MPMFPSKSSSMVNALTLCLTMMLTSSKELEGGRRLFGNRRSEKARLVVSHATTPTKEYYGELSAKSQDAVRAGNVIVCNSPTVLRQEAYEHRLKQQLNPLKLLELRLQQQDWLSSERQGEPYGFVHAPGDTPFIARFT